MDAFEQLVASLLEREGFWIRSSVKVNLTAADKRRIKRPTSPRWQLDIVAYRASTNSLLLVECKSYLFSSGVTTRAFEAGTRFSTRFKLFTDRTLFRVVRDRLKRELVDGGWCRPRPTVTLCLAAGRLASAREREKLRQLFDRRGWRLFDRDLLCARLLATADGGYDNDVASIVVKLLDGGAPLADEIDRHVSRRGLATDRTRLTKHGA